MVEPMVSISLLGHNISTHIDEKLGRLQIQNQGKDMLEKFIRIQTTDDSIIDDIVNTSTPSNFTNGKKLHEREASEEYLSLDGDLI